MSHRELRSLQELSGTRNVVANKSLRSGLVRGSTMDANQHLEDRLAELEAELSQARHSLVQKDAELDRLRGQVEEATLAANEVQCEAEQRSQALEERLAAEAESTRLRAEVEKLRALEGLREEHQRTMERERKLMDDWMQDVKERFRVEKQHLEERISALESTRPCAPSEALGSSMHAHRSASRSDDPFPNGEFHELEVGELSDGSERESQRKMGVQLTMKSHKIAKHSRLTPPHLTQMLREELPRLPL